MNTYHDNNHRPTLLAVQSDGVTLINITADPSSHFLNVSDGTTGSDNGPYQSRHDANHVSTLLAVSSQTTTINGVNYIQGVTPVVVYADSSGNLLVDSM